MIDAVLSYHADPISCGVTRFSQQLAKRLNVPAMTLRDWSYGHPLLSLKASEFRDNYYDLSRLLMDNEGACDVFWHDDGIGFVTSRARRVFAANEQIASSLRNDGRTDVITAWCPSLVEAQPREPITVLSFGMAHKLRTDLYATLKEKLDATGEPYVVYVSAALHDGTSFSDAAQSFEQLRRLFGQHFVFLGTLSDEAMVDRLRTCTYVAAFFEHGLRENNTSVMAALEAGARVLTNCDDYTPGLLRSVVEDITSPALLPMHRQQHAIREAFGWALLVELIRAT